MSAYIKRKELLAAEAFASGTSILKASQGHGVSMERLQDVLRYFVNAGLKAKTPLKEDQEVVLPTKLPWQEAHAAWMKWQEQVPPDERPKLRFFYDLITSTIGGQLNNKDMIHSKTFKNGVLVSDTENQQKAQIMIDPENEDQFIIFYIRPKREDDTLAPANYFQVVEDGGNVIMRQRLSKTGIQQLAVCLWEFIENVLYCESESNE